MRSRPSTEEKPSPSPPGPANRSMTGIAMRQCLHCCAESVEFLRQQTKHFISINAVQIPREVELIKQCGEPPRRPFDRRTGTALERATRGIVVQSRRKIDNGAICNELFSRGELLDDLPWFPQRIT